MALRIPLLAILASLWAHQSLAFSASNANPTLTLFDRFRAVCPADTSCIRQFDASLVSADDKEDDDDDSNAVWVAVYRSNNNKPSVLVKDSFLKAMKSATDTVPVPEPSSDLANSFVQGTGVAQEAPVAVARLVESKDFGNTWIMDSMRCVLKKENTDASCDGGSEHTEALTTGIDTLLLHYLQSLGRDRFEGAIRTKATLVSATLLEDRGFCEVQSLEKDMATHFSSLDDCLVSHTVVTLHGNKNISTPTRHPFLTTLFAVTGKVRNKIC